MYPNKYSINIILNNVFYFDKPLWHYCGMKSKTFVAICYLPAFIFFLNNGTDALITLSERAYTRPVVYNMRLSVDAYFLIFWLFLPLFVIPFKEEIIKFLKRLWHGKK